MFGNLQKYQRSTNLHILRHVEPQNCHIAIDKTELRGDYDQD